MKLGEKLRKRYQDVINSIKKLIPEQTYSFNFDKPAPTGFQQPTPPPQQVLGEIAKDNPIPDKIRKIADPLIEKYDIPSEVAYGQWAQEWKM